MAETSEKVCFYFITGFPRSLYSHTTFLCYGEKQTPNIEYVSTTVNQKKIKSSRK